MGQIIGLAIAVAIAVFVYQDANKRGMNGIGWSIGTFLLCIIILPIYLITRKPLLTDGSLQVPPGYQPPQTYQAPPRVCGRCGQYAPADAQLCPHCGAPLAPPQF